jgi:ABC-type multidrug transport system ATPase subunit
VLVASHETDALARIADRVLVLHEGRITRDMRHEELAQRFVRLELSLRTEGASWQPPAGAQWEPAGSGGVLTHTDWSPELEQALAADPRVASMRPIASDLADFVCAATAVERAA